MSYKKAYERLLAFEPKALGIGAYYDEEWGAYCAIGALVPERSKKLPEPFVRATITNVNVRIELGKDLDALGLTLAEAFELQAANDACTGPASQRYADVLAWLRERVEKEEGA